jgi:ABC-type sugar transport system substrate-binding protein
MSERRSSTGLTRREYLATAAAGTAALTAGCTGAVGGGGGGGGGYTLGYSNFTNSVPFEVMVRKSLEWWGEDQENLTIKTTAADGSTSQQIQDCRNLLRQGIDGLIVTPTDSNGLAKIAEEAEVPVFSADIPINSDQVGFHVGVNQNSYGYQAGKDLVKVMEESSAIEADTYKVLEIMMDQDNSNAVLRHRSFNEAIDEADNAEVVKQVEIDGYSATKVAEKVTTWLQSDPDVHGAFAPWAGGPVGVLKALERQDMKVEKGADGHVAIVSCDANATVIDSVKAGYIDRVVDQPVTFYGPLAAMYMQRHLDASGDGNGLPDIGSSVSTDQLTVSGGEHLDVQLWQKQRWSPGNVREFVTFDDEALGFPFLTTSIPRVNEENADAKWIWGNLTRQT